MPHIHAILLSSDAEAATVLRKHKSKIRRIFAKHLEYDQKEVALIARLLTESEAKLSANLDRIEFVVDTGVSTPITGSATSIYAELLKQIPKLEPIEFGVWVRSFPENSYCKHTPGG
jgi:hypothetical protein